jgi:hypothetical protein
MLLAGDFALTVDPLVTNDTTPALSGTVADADAAVTVTVNGTPHAAVNDGAGNWSIADNIIGPLAEGTYDVQVSATDGVLSATDDSADELTVDLTAPTVTVDNLITNDTTPQLTGTVDDAAATVEVTVDGQTLAATNNGDGTWTLADDSLAAIAEGTYHVVVQAEDTAGNVGSDITALELTIDTTAPTVTVDALVTNDTTPQLTGTVDDATATVEVTVDGQVLAATNNGDGTWTLADDTIAALAEGTYDVQVTATDAAGNVGNDATVGELTVDTTAPTVTVDSLTTNDTTPQLTGTVDDPTATITVTVNATPYAATNNGDGTWTLADNTIVGLGEGTYHVVAHAEDSAGNAANDPSELELTIDTTAPTVTVDSLLTNDTTPQLTGTVDDTTATVEVTVDGQVLAATNNGDGTWTLADDALAALAEGTYDVQATATDAAGNTGSDATVAELDVDTTAPAVTINPLTTADSTPALTGTVDDNGATIEVTVDGQVLAATNNGDGTWTLADDSLTALAEGTYDVQVTATDAAGNVGNDATVAELDVDTTAPTVTVDSLTTNDTTPQLTGTVDDPTATITVTVNATPYAATNNGDGTWTLADDTIAALAEGTYDVQVTATDAALAVGSDATVNELSVDLTAPTVTVNALRTTVLSPQITGTVDDPTAAIEVTIHDQTHAATNNGDGTWTLAAGTLADLAPTDYDVDVIASDAVGNVGSDATADELAVRHQVILGGDGQPQRVVFWDADGTRVAIVVSRGSTMAVELASTTAVSETQDAGRAIVTSNSGSIVDRISLGSNVRRINILTHGGQTPGTTLGGMIGDGVLGLLWAPGVSVGGSLDVNGGVDELELPAGEGINMDGGIRHMRVGDIYSDVTMNLVDNDVITRVFGSVINANFNLPNASMRRFMADRMVDSSVTVKVANQADANVDNVTDLPVLADLNAGGFIRRFIVTGRGFANAFQNSNVATDELGLALVRSAVLANGAEPFGFAANTIDRLRVRTDSWHRHGATWFDDAGDLTVRVV